MMIIDRYWVKGTAMANNAAARMKIGNVDLWYNLVTGYYDYLKRVLPAG